MCSAWVVRWSAPRSRPISCARTCARSSTAASATSDVWKRSRKWRGRMSKSRLHELAEHGQSVWLDYLSREILSSGKLARMMEEDAVVGVTSNPTIFQKALAEGDAYDDDLKELL